MTNKLMNKNVGSNTIVAIGINNSFKKFEPLTCLKLNVFLSSAKEIPILLVMVMNSTAPNIALAFLMP